MNTNALTCFQYRLALPNAGNATVRVEQKVNGVYQYLTAQQTQTTSGIFELVFTPSNENIRVSVSGTSGFALQQISLERDNVDTLVNRYLVSPSDYGEPHLSSVFTSYACSGYRYGFQGQEKDGEVKGRGDSYDFGARFYDSRLGRWLSIDPLFQNFPWQSPYVAFDNNPIYYNDPMGMASEIAIDSPPDWYENQYGEVEYFEDMTQDKFWTSQFTTDENGEFLSGQTWEWSKINYVPNQKEEQTSGFSNDVDFGVQLITSKIQGAAQLVVDEGAHKYTEVAGVARDAHLPAAANIARLAGAAGNFYSIGDKVLDTYNAFEREDYGQASRDATVATGYAVATAMMLAPTGVSQIAGGLLFIAFAIYDAVND